ncbi:ribonuclease P protein subunit p40 [Hippocampus comes]|uniref:Ribonuclease P/MRP subunit p40 n=1 Tax=Hippocampus comes TaxID=109280 RepID=A0A3Q2XZN7_HIPCM|nr:PREDICTED: ribonuclease P protein subunit p40 [Hippocampus comes]
MTYAGLPVVIVSRCSGPKVVEVKMSSKTLLNCETSSLRHPNNRLSAHLEQLPFNYRATVLLPDCGCAPSQLDETLRSFQSFYLVRNLPLYELLDEHLGRGSVCGLSYKTRIDEDNCAFLKANGHLCLSLDKDSYELLGIEGKACKPKSSRYVVSVDLNDRSMAPGRPRYQRLFSGLTSRLPLKMEFLLAPASGDPDALQPLLSRYEWSRHTPEVSCRLLTHLSRPDPLTCDLRSYDPFDLLEWLGAVQADISCDNAADSFLSSLACPHPSAQSSQSSFLLEVRGLLLPQNIMTLVKQLSHFLERPLSPPWAAVTVHGFMDNLHVHERHFYTLVLFPDHAYSLHLATPAS